jgi:predicted RNA-binding protein YlxR (DUF448 family)
MGRDKRHVPHRTCIGCGTKRSKRELVRLVLDPQDRVVPDDSRKEPGRGAYVCESRSCLEAVIRGRGLNRAFRREGLFTIHSSLLIKRDTCDRDTAAR